MGADGFVGTSFELATDDARAVEVAIDAAGAVRPGYDFAYILDRPEDPSRSVAIVFTPYLPHGNPVYVHDEA